MTLATTLAGMFALAALSTSCGGDAPAAEVPASEAPAGAASSRLVVAVVDFSGSLTSHATSDARAYLKEVVQGLDFGDRFVLLEMYRTGTRDSVGRFVQDMPDAMRPDAITSYDRRQLDAAKRGVLNALPVFFDPRFVGSVPTTDILTTLHIASEYLRDADERTKELLLLSDMLQSTPSGFEFGGARRMPTDGWVASQQSASRIPPLDGTCVVVIGGDPTTPAGQQVRAFWIDWFEAAGAALEPANYRARPPVEVIGCD
ncbi:MAG TPA: hypothetical protein VMN78_05950 [Longimicrobiales bacterium]|nr:hypothetical protein [Longimicrobiales bacterium]